MGRRFLGGLLVLALLLSTAGCGGPIEAAPDASEPEASARDVLRQEQPTPAPFTLAYYPDYSLHPALAESRANLVLSPLLYEGLFWVDERFRESPELCASWSVSPDGLTWSFLLKEGVTFSDGTPLTGTIAAQSLRAALTDPASRYAGRVRGLASVTGDETSVTLRLTAPNAALPVLLDVPIALDSSGRPLGTGPYVLSETEDDALLTPRRDWHGGQSLPFDNIYLFPVRQADDLIAAFGSGEVTLLDADLTATNALGYAGSYEVWDYPTCDLVYLGFRCDRGLFRDAEVRRAVARAVDREAVVSVSFAGHARASALPFHPSSALYSAYLARQAGYAPGELVALLPQLKLPEAPLTLLVNGENSAKVSAAQAIAEQLQAAGLPVAVEKKPWGEYLSDLAAGNFELYLGETLLTADFDLSALLGSGGGLNYGRFWDGHGAEMLAALSRGETAEACRWLLEQAPIAPICFKNGSVLTQWGRLTGLSPRQDNIFTALEGWKLDPDRTAGTNEATEEMK